MHPPKTRYATTEDGTSVAYQVFGEGELHLVVVHAWFSHLEVYWEEPHFERFMRRLARGLRVIHFDKRGTGLSDRISSPPTLEARMGDIRAVMDAEGVELAALLGWGDGAALAALFAATYPSRTVALCFWGNARIAWAPDYPWGQSEEEWERETDLAIQVWGDEDRAMEWARAGFGDWPEAAPFDDSTFLRWCAKFARYSCTPAAAKVFEEMHYATDVRRVLPAIQVPTQVVYPGGVPENEQVGAEAEHVARLIPGAQLVAVPNPAWVPWVDDPEPLVRTIERFLGSVHAEEVELDRVLATVMFTDVVGSTEIATSLGDAAWRRAEEEHHRVVRALLARYRGREIDTAGDGFFATFDGPARAIRCAGSIVQAVQRVGMQVRVGIHTGEVVTLDHKVGGVAVVVGARIGALAAPGEVLVSQTVKDLVAGSGLTFQDRGMHRLKGIQEQWRVLEVMNAGPLL